MEPKAAVQEAILRLGPPEALAQACAALARSQRRSWIRRGDLGPAAVIIGLEVILVAASFARASISESPSAEFLVDPGAFRSLFGDWLPVPEPTPATAVLFSALLAGPLAAAASRQTRPLGAAFAIAVPCLGAAAYSLCFGFANPKWADLRLAGMVQALYWAPIGFAASILFAELRRARRGRFRMPAGSA
jgi:hypothetical protein